ncbi:fructose-1,6-bisphosphatase/inositol monophosphatase family enzyme [Oikeobacillus pervagus]|uniref:Fructose-1,6-bisphosphatase/inositol monophosphatase family enzyme n=1 Tax=Oikeobacillus pervagus TaxID=1325931 RepID=A0AAJ1WLL0_9BACI|nr:fructose-1,6-bisphosphatase/inositol monophosphatase family enzyme [Oikeobacillus pervagus]
MVYYFHQDVVNQVDKKIKKIIQSQLEQCIFGHSVISRFFAEFPCER